MTRTAVGPALDLGSAAARAASAAANAAGGISQATIDNLIRMANWNYGTATCVNPMQIPSYCP